MVYDLDLDLDELPDLPLPPESFDSMAIDQSEFDLMDPDLHLIDD